jgi:hypothetical protein
MIRREKQVEIGNARLQLEFLIYPEKALTLRPLETRGSYAFDLHSGTDSLAAFDMADAASERQSPSTTALCNGFCC